MHLQCCWRSKQDKSHFSDRANGPHHTTVSAGDLARTRQVGTTRNGWFVVTGRAYTAAHIEGEQCWPLAARRCIGVGRIDSVEQSFITAETVPVLDERIDTGIF